MDHGPDRLPRLGSSAGLTRRYNRLVVLGALRRGGSLSRVELARASGLTPQAIANIVEDLLGEGLIRETGRRRGLRGQPQIDIELDPDGGYAIGLQVEAGRHAAIAVDLTGAVVGRMALTQALEDEAALAEFLADVDRTFAGRFGAGRCLGIGLVSSAPFDAAWPQAGASASPFAPQPLALARRLSERLGREIWPENNATAAALAEKLYGKAQGLEDFLYIFVGEGVGGGIVIRGEPYRGHRGNAAEFGHMVVAPEGEPCHCGARGCLDGFLSLASLRRRCGLAGEIACEAVPDAWFEAAARALAVAIVGLENSFDPERIILGGSAPTALLERLLAYLGQLPPTVRAGAPGERLVVSDLGDSCALPGAAALPILAATSPSPRTLTKSGLA